MAEDTMTIEEHFTQMENLLQQLESKDISLEDSFACYQTGMEHLKACNTLLEQVEKKVQMLNEDGRLSPFEEGMPEEKE